MPNVKITTVIQARTSSSRLPNKVLLSLCGKPLLIRMVERVMRANLSGNVVIATSTESEDDVIEELCKRNGINFYRGNLNDLLDRHLKAAELFETDAVVKIPSDCPLIDPRVIDKVLKYFIDNYAKYDFVSNLHPATYPDGNDVEVMKMDAIKKAWNEAERKLEREHTTPYIWENPELFSIGNVVWESGEDFSSKHRWTIDYEEDYTFIRTVYEELYNKKPDFSLYDILNLLKEKPYIYEINSKYAGEYWYRRHLDELKHIDEYKKKQERRNQGND